VRGYRLRMLALDRCWGAQTFDCTSRSTVSRKACIGLAVTATQLALFHAGPAAAALLEVPESHTTIAAALLAASYGDTVSVAPGTYYECNLWLDPGVSLIGRGSRTSVMIDAQLQGRILEGEDLDANNRIQCITFRGGYQSCCYGAGLRLIGSPTLEDVAVEECTLGSGSGAGVYSEGSPEIRNARFSANQILETTGSRGGGLALAAAPGDGPLLQEVAFENNSAAWGGGLHYWYHRGSLEALTFSGNSAATSGGGAYFMNMGSDGVGPLVINCVWVGNHSAHTGGAVAARASVVLEDCTLVGNSADYAYGAGGGFYSASSWDAQDHPQLIRSIVADNVGGGVGLGDAPQVQLECCDVYGNIGGNYVGAQVDWTGMNGNISADPLYCDSTDPLAFYLQADSPCAPPGNPCGVLIGAFPVMCSGTAVDVRSWGAIKALY
jgi:hypothetical protein